MGRLLLLFALSALIVAADDCVNDDSTTDSEGNTCSGFYDYFPDQCGEYDDDDFKKEQCCACDEKKRAPYITLSVLLPVLFVLLAGAAYVRCKKMEDETYAAAARRVLCCRGTKVRAVVPTTSAAAAAPADDAAWALKRPIALQTLDVLAVTVAGRADLEAKISELRALIDAPAPVANGVAAPVPEVNGAAAPAAMDPTADVSTRDWTSQRLLALRAFEARAWRRRQARIGALDDDAYERGRAFQAYEDLLAELA